MIPIWTQMNADYQDIIWDGGYSISSTIVIIFCVMTKEVSSNLVGGKVILGIWRNFNSFFQMRRLVT